MCHSKYIFCSINNVLDTVIKNCLYLQKAETGEYGTFGTKLIVLLGCQIEQAFTGLRQSPYGRSWQCWALGPLLAPLAPLARTKKGDARRGSRNVKKWCGVSGVEIVK